MVKTIGVPSVYRDFQCIATDCTDTCCAGWQVDVDDASWERYQRVEGEFGDYIHSVMVEIPDEEGQFRLTEKGWCPFLNETGLCDMYAELGEDSLCQTCTNYPRYMEDYGTLREVGVAFSCPEAARLMLAESAPMTFEKWQVTADKEQWADVVKDVLKRTSDSCESDVCEKTVKHREISKERKVTAYVEETEEFDEAYFRLLYKAREVAFRLAQNRAFSIDERVALYLDYCVMLQEVMDTCEEDELADEWNEVMESYADAGWLGKRYDVLGQVVRQWSDAVHDTLDDGAGAMSAYSLYDEVIARGELRYRLLPEYAAVLYQELRHCKPQWSPLLQQAEQVLHEACDSGAYHQYYEDFTVYMSEREYEYEHLLSYYVFRYFCKAYFDDDVYGKAQLAVMSYLLLKELGVCQWVRQNGEFTKGDQSELFHLYSRELEHSDENYDTFVDMLKMENMCNYEHLLALLVER